jgi:hypothetical protein
MALRSITPDSVSARGLGNDLERTFAADTVVVVSYHEPNRELADHLCGHGFGVHLVGDVNGTSSIQSAIHSAARAARSI